MSNAEPGWDLYRSFLAVLRKGSLSGAARELALTQPTIARHIGALEAAIGFELFIRSQHGLAPTEGALELRPYAETLAATSAALLRSASGHGATIKGAVRVSASEMMGAQVLPQALTGLREAHSELEIELVLSNALDDILRRDADIAVRMVEPAQEALVVKKLGSVTLGLYAHRRYLARVGEPQDFADLRTHSLIGYDRETPAIRALLARLPAYESVRFALRTDSDIAQLMAIKAGFGIGVCQMALARRDPGLRRVLAGAFDLKLGMWLVMHENLRSTPRCRIVFDGLAAALKTHVD